jgi:hypothetical protein
MSLSELITEVGGITTHGFITLGRRPKNFKNLIREEFMWLTCQSWEGLKLYATLMLLVSYS